MASHDARDFGGHFPLLPPRSRSVALPHHNWPRYARDNLSDSPSEQLYGIITLVDIWRLARLERREKLLKKDTNVYALSADLEIIFFSAVLAILDAHRDHEP